MDVLLLIRSKNIGPKTFFDLIENLGSAKKSIEFLKEKPKSSIYLASEKSIEREIANTHKIGGNFITYHSVLYPTNLRNLSDRPPILSYLGNLDLLNNKICSIVGSRNASLHGQNFASKISRELSNENISICSGMARGIDTAAHKAAKHNIAVIAGGIDNVYPRENKTLYERISNEGIIFSENPIGFIPKSESFPKRNRIIAGLANVIIIVEANIKSGSLITAKYGLEYGKEIGAVPGFPLDPRSHGTHKLIKEGAALIENTQDIFELMRLEYPELTIQKRPKNKPPIKLSGNNCEKKEILSLLSNIPSSIDQIVEKTGIEISLVNLILLELELEGNVVRHRGNKFALQL